MDPKKKKKAFRKRKPTLQCLAKSKYVLLNYSLTEELFNV